MSGNYLKNLNPDQVKAVTYEEGPLLILAGAGSGKTRTITHRIAYLLDHKKESPYSVLAVTFTNKAANEMKNRVEKQIKSATRGLWIGTFHSICLRILKKDIEHLDGFKANFTIYDDQDQIKLLRECLKKLDYNERIYEPRSIRAKIDGIKNKGKEITNVNSEILDERVINIFNLYDEELRRHNALDFSDLLFLTVKLFEEHPTVLEHYQNRFSNILVDEYQDTNNLQYKIVKYIAQKSRNLFVVGDDNQSIYSWRGANIENILNFEKDFPDTEIIKLEKNYRSTKNILEISNELIKYNFERKEKTLWTDNPKGDLIEYYEAADEIDEAKNLISKVESEKKDKSLSYKDISVFYRTNNQSKAIEDELILSGIPYSIIGGVGFYQRAEVKDIIAYLRVVTNRDDNISLRRIINVPTRGIGKVTVNNLDLISQEKNISLFESISFAIENKIFSAGTISKLQKFSDLIIKMAELTNDLSAKDLIEELIDETEYLDFIESEEERISNVSDLVNLAGEFEIEDEETNLQDFLDWIALASDIDRFDQDKDRITLMTLHTAKGLEFPYVFITGLEEGLLPHFRSIGEIKQLEEERRLFYVGITRTMKKLFISSASSRRVFGKEQPSIPSRFIKEIPTELLDWKSFDDNYKISKYKKNTFDKYDSDFDINFIDNINTNNHGDSSIKKGQGVEHTKFGKGIVLNVDGSGEKAKVTVMFKGVGKKTILASFLS